MKNNIAVIKTHADLLKFYKSFCETHVTALNGVLDKLPEILRADLLALRDSLNNQLKDLPPLDQVPAAQEAASALNSFADMIVRMQDYASGLLERLQGLQKDLGAKTTALYGLEERVSKGDLVARDKVKELCDLARNEGANSVKPEVIATRKGALELAGLPIPSDEVLGLPAEQYSSRLQTARENVQKLGEKGMKLGGRGDSWVKQTAWLPATEFAGQMTMIEEFIGHPPAGRKADPLLGNQPGAKPEGTTTSICLT